MTALLWIAASVVAGLIVGRWIANAHRGLASMKRLDAKGMEG